MQVATVSEGASGRVLDFMQKVLRKLGMPGAANHLTMHIIRKLAHFLEFALLGVILCNVYAAFGVSHRTATGYILFLGLAVAVTDEYIQLHAPGRSALVTDVILDFSGVFFIWLTREVWSWAKR